RVGLFAARAPGTPDADSCPARRARPLEKGLPRDLAELATVPDEGCLLVRYLVDEPVHQTTAARRIRGRAHEGGRAESWRGTFHRGADGCLPRRWQHDARLPADEVSDPGELGLHPGPAAGSARRPRRRAAICPGTRQPWPRG